MTFKLKPADYRQLRQRAATEAKLGPRQISLCPALRHPVSFVSCTLPAVPSFNDWAWGKVAETDLFDNGWSLSDLKRIGVELNGDGEARVDFYVYELTNFGDGCGIVNGELSCNVQAIIKTVDGKPQMVGVTAD